MKKIDKCRRVFRKYFEYIVTKIKLIYSQKIYICGDVRVKYILKKASETDALVVVFSSCTRKGIRARYNYLRTLSDVKANKLYVLDDYAKDHRGSYYLGKNLDFSEEKAVKSLINKMVKEYKIQKIILCGSSKGGYSALNFGLQIPDSYILAGAPQYFLYTYLKESGNLDALRHIMGDTDSDRGDFLDYYLRNRIEANKETHSQHVYLHYSNAEHTYLEHIQFLLEDLKKNGYQIVEDVASYTNHSDISYYFPDYLVKTINDILM